MRSRLLGAAAVAAGLVLLVPAAVSQASGDDRSATVYTDDYGVPHIEATDDLALSEATGYLLAQQRLAQTLQIRLAAQGRAAEVAGEEALALDVATRQSYYDAGDVDRQYRELPEEIRQALRAYADGFNRGMREVMADPGRRPRGLGGVAGALEPWRPQDSLSVAMLYSYARFAGMGGAGQLDNARLLQALRERHGPDRGLAMWEELRFRDDLAAATIIPEDVAGSGTGALRSERAGAAQLDLVDRLGRPLEQAGAKLVEERQAAARALALVPIPRSGSYAAAVGGQHTASGGGLLLGSPQTGLESPALFWQLGQHAPGRDCAGVSIPGAGPWAVIGWCNDHAWTLVTGNAGEQVDNYVVETDPGNPRRYRYQGGWREMEVRRETFATAGGRSVTYELESTVHGPVVARDASGRVAVAQRRAQRGSWAQNVLGFHAWNTAQSLAEFEAATDRLPATYNLLYADADGHVLYRLTGRQPVRADGIDRRLPTPGGGGHEWQGMLPAHELPRVLDPPGGYLAVNQGNESKPAHWWPNSSGSLIGQASRLGGNQRLLVEAGPRTVADLERLDPELLERRDLITPVFAAHIRAALEESDDPELRRALELFEAWAAKGFPRTDRDGDGKLDDPALTLFGADEFGLPDDAYPHTLWSVLLERVYGDELGGLGLPADDLGGWKESDWLARLSQLKTALDGRLGDRPLHHDWIDDGRTARQETAGELIRAAVAAAIDARATEFGTGDMRTWLRPVPEHAVGGMDGSGVAPLRGWDHGTYSQIVDPRAGEGRWVLFPGNGTAASPHHTDQRDAYLRYQHLPIPHTPDGYRAGGRRRLL